MKKLVSVILGVFFGLLIGIPLADHLENPYRPATSGTNDDVNIDIPKPNPGTLKQTPHVARITSPQKIRAFVTAYDPYDEICVEQYAHIWPRMTPGGSDPETRGIATDPEVIPYGTLVMIPGQGILTVDDTGRDMRHAARKPDGAFYWLDIRISAPYADFPNNPGAAQKEAHLIAERQGGHWMDVLVIPPSSN